MLVQALKARYWKPVQSGSPTDTHTIKQLCGPNTLCHPERHRLAMPASPHAAAQAEGKTLQLADFALPSGTGPLVVEGAGGLMVPLNQQHLMLDLMAQLNLPVLLVANLYLGSINHTLLSLNVLQQKGLPITGIVFNGPDNPQSRQVITAYSGVPQLHHVPRLPNLEPATLAPHIQGLKNALLP